MLDPTRTLSYNNLSYKMKLSKSLLTEELPITRLVANSKNVTQRGCLSGAKRKPTKQVNKPAKTKPSMVIKVATLNLCLGLPNKKTIVKNLIVDEAIDLLCLQETEVDVNLDHKLLSFPGFNYESENNSEKSRVGMYINSSLKYNRRNNLEGPNSHVIIVDVKSERDLRIINVYRSFNPSGGKTPRQFFTYQLSLIKAAMTNNCILLGDFNLDWNLKGVHGYAFKNYFRDMDEELSEFNLIQIINTATWSRIVRDVLKESILDHVYTSDPLSIMELKFVTPTFGDHKLIMFKFDVEKPPETISYRRSWYKYSKEELCNKLSEEDWDLEAETVQSYWDELENKIINIVDLLTPITTFINNTYCKEQTPPLLERKLNLRKRLLK